MVKQMFVSQAHTWVVPRGRILHARRMRDEVVEMRNYGKSDQSGDELVREVMEIKMSKGDFFTSPRGFEIEFL
jgi:hypothetical protein